MNARERRLVELMATAFFEGLQANSTPPAPLLIMGKKGMPTTIDGSFRLDRVASHVLARLRASLVLEDQAAKTQPNRVP